MSLIQIIGIIVILLILTAVLYTTRNYIKDKKDKYILGSQWLMVIALIISQIVFSIK